MKKFKGFLFLLALLVLMPLSVQANEKVNVYLFRRNGCGFCESALQFFNTLSEDEEYKNYFNLVEKEVSTNKKNASVMESVAKDLNVDLQGVPFIVIGTEKFEGYTSSWDETIKEVIKTAYNNSDGNYKDIVAPYFSGNEEKDNGAAVTIIILIVAGAGIAFLIYMARDGVTSEVNNTKKVSEEVKEEQPQKTTAKKTTTSTKKTTTKKKTNHNTKKK